jgi:hypothetical protein
MKKFLFVAAAFVFSFAVNAQTTQPAQPKPDDVAKFNEETHDFGKVVVGTPVTYNFKIKNTSDKPIVVEHSWASCGCTVPGKIEAPIMPGTSTDLKVTYSAAAVGPINKDIYVQLAGIAQPKTLRIVGEVLSAEAFAEYTKNQDKQKEAEKASKPKTKEKGNN